MKTNSKAKTPAPSKDDELSDAWAGALSPGGFKELKLLAEFRKSRQAAEQKLDNREKPVV